MGIACGGGRNGVLIPLFQSLVLQAALSSPHALVGLWHRWSIYFIDQSHSIGFFSSLDRYRNVHTFNQAYLYLEAGTSMCHQQVVLLQCIDLFIVSIMIKPKTCQRIRSVSSCSHYHMLKTVHGTPRLNVVIPVTPVTREGDLSDGPGFFVTCAWPVSERFWSILQNKPLMSSSGTNSRHVRCLFFCKRLCLFPLLLNLPTSNETMRGSFIMGHKLAHTEILFVRYLKFA